MRLYAAAGAAVLAVLAAGCGTSQASPAPGAKTSTPAASQAANVLVCRHYVAQRAWVKGLAYPTLADGLRFAGYVAADSAGAQRGTRLAADLAAMSGDEQALRSSYAASARVLAGCAALGVKP